MTDAVWKAALLRVREIVRKHGEASCTGQASDIERGWVRGHNDAYAHVLRDIDDAVATAAKAELEPAP